MIPMTAEGRPRQEAGAGWARVPWCSASSAFLCRGQVLAKSLQHHAAHQPLSFGLQPTCSGHMPTVRVQFAHLQPQSKEGSMQCPEHHQLSAGAHQRRRRRKEGGIGGGMEWTSSGLIQIQIPKYCILEKSLKKKVGRGLQVVTSTHHQGRMNYTCNSPEIPALLTRENCLNSQPEFLWFTPTAPCACHG